MFYKIAFTVGSTTYNSYDDWGLIAVSKPVIAAPAVSKDGKATANQSSWQFMLVDLADFPDIPIARTSTYGAYLAICNALNGKECTVKLYADSTLYDTATGTIKVSDFSTHNYRSFITLSGDLFSTGTTTESSFAEAYSLKFTIGNSNYNTFDDWHLTPQSIPIVNAPKARTNYVITPAANGAIDLTEVFGSVYYNNAEGSWTFKVLDSYYSTASTIFSTVVGALNGKSGTVKTLDGTGTTYNGRFEVGNPSISDGIATLTISYIIEPWGIT